MFGIGLCNPSKLTVLWLVYSLTSLTNFDMIVDNGRMESENEAVCYTLKTWLMIVLFCLCFVC